MKTRIVAGVIAAILLLALIEFGPAWMMMTVVLSCALLAYLEFDRLFFTNKDPIRQILMSVLVAWTIFSLWLYRDTIWMVVSFTFVLLCCRQVAATARGLDCQSATQNLCLEILGYLYVVSLFGFLVPIGESGERGRDFVLLFFLLVFLGDTAAYFVGSRFGRRKLAPGISPKKTVEGAIAALVISVLAAAGWCAVVYRAELFSTFSLKVILFAPVASALAQCGDLFESILKRSQDRKDSGSFLPGHGGLLDRVDGFALASPVFYLYLTQILEQGQ